MLSAIIKGNYWGINLRMQNIIENKFIAYVAHYATKYEYKPKKSKLNGLVKIVTGKERKKNT